MHMNFIASDETLGRDTPSQELKITCRYLANLAECYGLKPLMPDGSYYQVIPVEVSKVSEVKTQLKLTVGPYKEVFRFPYDFGTGGRSTTEGRVSGSVVFVGYGLEAADQGWDDYGDLDLAGKIVVMLEGRLPEEMSAKFGRFLRNRATAARRKGAAAVLTIINPERENKFTQTDTSFSNIESMGRYRHDYGQASGRQTIPAAQARTFLQAEIRHDPAAAILGVSRDQLNYMFAALSRGEQVPRRELGERNVELILQPAKRTVNTQNVIAYVEGSDPELKDEYVVIGSHPDHLGVRNGQVMNGADDNVSGVVAMLEIAQALLIESPKRSVILTWFTGEEKGLMGSHIFANNCPVPVGKISAMLNLDMICRNDPDHLYLVASKLLSTELDASIHDMNDKYIHLNFDYEYEDPNHPDRFYRRSDHYPFNLFGVPAVWLFCGTTEDYHQPTDTIDRVDFEKMLKVTQLTYLVCCDIGNKDEMLQLDVNPQVTTRGRHNIPVQLQIQR